MSDIQIFIAALLISVAVLNALANWLRVPYPIVLVIGGLALGLVPGIPAIELDPNLVLLSPSSTLTIRRGTPSRLRI